VVEAKVLEAQVALMTRDTARAAALLAECADTNVEEPEPRQHRLLTEAWLLLESEDPKEALVRVEAAMKCFPDKRRVGDHTPHMLSRLSRYRSPEYLTQLLTDWRQELATPIGAQSLPRQEDAETVP
jgi:uncharacterized protein HemY